MSAKTANTVQVSYKMRAEAGYGTRLQLHRR